eukprot:6795276-Heterocapsa_arctica.AAC.1
MLSPAWLSTPFLARVMKEMLRIASAETDWRSHSLTPGWFCQAFILRGVSGFCLFAARRSLQSRSIQSLARNVQDSP